MKYPTLKQNFNQEQIIYIAGLIDHKSSFSIMQDDRTNFRSFRSTICITCNEKTADWLINHFGGSKVRAMKANIIPSYYRYNIHGNRISEICKLIMPYVFNKKQHVEIMLQMRDTYRRPQHQKGITGKPHVDDEIIEIRNQLMKELKKINRPNKAAGRPETREEDSD